MKTVTLAQVIDNMERNGYKQAFGGLMFNKGGDRYIPSKNKVASACALGQGMLNLNLQSLRWTQDWGPEFVKRVAHLNDIDKKTPDEIAKIVRKEYEQHLNEKLRGHVWGDNTYIPGSSIR